MFCFSKKHRHKTQICKTSKERGFLSGHRTGAFFPIFKNLFSSKLYQNDAKVLII